MISLNLPIVSLGLSATYIKTEATRRDEYYDEAYRYRKGHAIDGVWGLKNLGFFKDAADVAASPDQKSAVILANYY